MSLSFSTLRPLSCHGCNGQILPVLYRRRLYVFWPIAIEKATQDLPPVPQQGSTPSTALYNAKRYFEVRLAWTEQRNSAWTTKQIAPVVMTKAAGALHPSPALLRREAGPIHRWSLDAEIDRTNYDLVIKIYQRAQWQPQVRGLKATETPLMGEFRLSAGNGAVTHRLAKSSDAARAYIMPGRSAGSAFSLQNQRFRSLTDDFNTPLPLSLYLSNYEQPEFSDLVSNTLLSGTPGGVFELVTSKQDRALIYEALTIYNGYTHYSYVPFREPFFYQDNVSTYFVDVRGRPTDRFQITPGIESPTDTTFERVGGVNVTTHVTPSTHIVQDPQTIDPNDLEPSIFEAVVTPRHYQFTFAPFYHPHVDILRRQVNSQGLDGIFFPKKGADLPIVAQTGLSGEMYRQSLKGALDFNTDYQPGPLVATPYPKEDFDFSFGGAYSIYNWELFFHIPFRIATHLSQNQRFEDAQRWFHAIFDPTDSNDDSLPRRAWKFRPFVDAFPEAGATLPNINDLLTLLHDSNLTDEDTQRRQAIIDQLNDWRKNPFNPHRIARLRIKSYMTAVVMKYLDNLIAWGDQRFRQETIESLNEATQYYLLAAELLGPRPQEVDAGQATAQTYDALKNQGFDATSNALIEGAENLACQINNPEGDPSTDDMPPIGTTLYFCVPPNTTLLLEYWDRVEDRLFKLRNGLTIDGKPRRFALFAPPLDPGMLVRATAAAGGDFSRVLTSLYAPRPHHRFALLLQRAVDYCRDVQGLGSAMLTALEKQDVEALSMLRSQHEASVTTLGKNLRYGLEIRRLRKDRLSEP